MKLFQRGAIFALLLIFIIATTATFAQDDDTIDFTGSRIVAEIFEAIAEAVDQRDVVNIEVTGTTSGFAVFCAGDADIAGANRPISLDEDAECIQNDVEYVEYMVGYSIAAIISHPDLTFAECLTTSDLNTIFAPSASGQVIDWGDTGLTEDEIDLSTYLPSDDTVTYALFDRSVGGVGLRADATISTDAEIIDAVGNTPGAVGVVNFAALDSSANVQIVEIESGELGGCFSPSPEAVSSRQYTIADRLFLYVNQASQSSETLLELLEFTFSEDSLELIVNSGSTPPEMETLELNQVILAGGEAGRQFSLDVAAFEVPDNLFGTITVSGSATLVGYIQALTQQFGAEYSGVFVETNLQGEPAGLRRLCNGEIDILASTRDMPADAVENCEANNITTSTFELGGQAIVLLANADDDYAQCLTTDHVLAIWSSTSTDEINSWADVDDSFPDVEFTLFAPSAGTGYTDRLLTRIDGPVIPIRLDTETDADPLYRAAATANVEGSLTFMSWPEYQRVLGNNQQNIQLVEIDRGDGCTAPTPETIFSGEYAYNTPAKLIVNNGALAAPEIQSLLWYIFSDSNYSLLENAGLIGVNFGDLPAIRSELQDIFADALASSLIPEPDVEATPEIEPSDDENGDAVEDDTEEEVDSDGDE